MGGARLAFLGRRACRGRLDLRDDRADTDRLTLGDGDLDELALEPRAGGVSSRGPPDKPVGPCRPTLGGTWLSSASGTSWRGFRRVSSWSAPAWATSSADLP